MSVRGTMLCALALALGCTEQPSAPVDAAIPLSKHDRIAPSDNSNTWIVRRMTSRAVSAELSMSDAGRKSNIITVPRISADGGVIPPRPRPDEDKDKDKDEDEDVDEGPAPNDAGQRLPADEEDAGNDEPPPCDSPGCLCKRICERGLKLECPSEDSLDKCIELCSVVIPDCYDQSIRVLRCSAELPDAAYSCDPEIEVFVMDGCTAENNALDMCSLL